ncbi:hypothetical protein ZHAS_00007864 [Anopheles sinensis]|uniref:Uncharacterized protein n=1 Tax=Anopheles sinensis TaxID=74873 RepID=A0A084VQZ6_ANOSI|nr:hypothetical protein ZHAS_00007864 [Anopheles sinensis]
MLTYWLRVKKFSAEGKLRHQTNRSVTPRSPGPPKVLELTNRNLVVANPVDFGTPWGDLSRAENQTTSKGLTCHSNRDQERLRYETGFPKDWRVAGPDSVHHTQAQHAAVRNTHAISRMFVDTEEAETVGQFLVFAYETVSKRTGTHKHQQIRDSGIPREHELSVNFGERFLELGIVL